MSEFWDNIGRDDNEEDYEDSLLGFRLGGLWNPRPRNGLHYLDRFTHDQESESYEPVGKLDRSEHKQPVLSDNDVFMVEFLDELYSRLPEGGGDAAKFS